MAVSTSKYHSVAVWLHWLIAFLIIGQFAGGLYMHELPASSFKFDLYQWHKSFGITVLLLSLLRLGWRFTHKVPPLPETMPHWERLAAQGTHILFYVLMIGVPLIGWLMVSASTTNIPTVLFKIIPWPHIAGIPRSETLEDIFKEVHEYMAFATMGLLALHVLAGLKHHFFEKDDVLTRMVTFLKPKG